MKKVLALMLALVMAFGLAACANNNPQGSAGQPGGTPAGGNEGGQAPAVTDKVAMITDYGDITDQSFNQTTYEACKEYCDANNIPFTYYKPNGDSTAERVGMVEAAIADGYNIIVMPGYAFGGTIVAVSNDYPDTKFIALDVAAGDILEAGVGESYTYNPADYNVADYYNTSNVYCAIYQEELCGYMAGYAAVKLGYTKLGFLGGMAVPAVQRYGYGFVQGADAAAAEINLTNQVSVNYVYGNLFRPDPSITAYMDTWYQSSGTEVVFACGGGIYASAAEAAQKVGGKLIGVDVDQAGIIDNYAEGMTVTSAMKGLGATVKDTLNDVIVNGNWANYAGKIETLGLVSATDPEANYVKLPLDSTQWESGKFTEEDYYALVAKMYNGEITVSSDTTTEPAVSIAVDYQGNIL